MKTINLRHSPETCPPARKRVKKTLVCKECYNKIKNEIKFIFQFEKEPTKFTVNIYI